jgi:hypothetical protein
MREKKPRRRRRRRRRRFAFSLSQGWSKKKEIMGTGIFGDEVILVAV